MHEQIEFLKRAVSKGDTLGVANCYVIKGDKITARDSNLQAGAPYPVLIGEDFNIRASDLDAALSRIKTGVSVEFLNDRVIIQGRRVKVDIACVIDEPPAVDYIEEGWLPIPPGFMNAINIAKTFILDKDTNYGIHLKGDKVTVVSNRAGIDITVDGMDMTECSITLSCAEFLLAQGKLPTHFFQDGHTMWFQWTGGYWVRSQLHSSNFPATADRVFSSAGDVYSTELTDDWREAYADISALADDLFELLPNKMSATKETSVVDVTVDTPGVETSSFWSTTALAPMVAVATHWNPAAWPKPAAFKGANCRGIVASAMGRGNG